MKHIFWRIYKRPKNKIINGSATYNCFGIAAFLKNRDDGFEYELIGFGYYWRIK